ncbi:Origin of replication complex subunit 6 [Linum perenne]
MAIQSRSQRQTLISPPFIITSPLTQSSQISDTQHRTSTEMSISDIANRLGLADSNQIVRKAAEIRRLCDVQFGSSVIGVGEVCKTVMCLEIAATRLQAMFDRRAAMKISGMSEKAYTRSFNLLQNSIGFKYKDRFLASLPASRRASADFTRPVFTAVAFYLSAKKQKLKIDKDKLIQVCGTSESEFLSVSNCMKDLCHDVFGISKETIDPIEQVSRNMKRKRVDESDYEKCKRPVVECT